MPAKFDYRRSRRVRLKKPAPAFVSNRRAEITDVSVEGIGITHEAPLVPGRETYLEFNWGGTLLVLRCMVAATRPIAGGRLHRSGLMVIGGDGAEIYRGLAKTAVEALLERESKLPPTI